jgi:hypothetical protein
VNVDVDMRILDAELGARQTFSSQARRRSSCGGKKQAMLSRSGRTVELATRYWKMRGACRSAEDVTQFDQSDEQPKLVGCSRGLVNDSNRAASRYSGTWDL